MGDILLEILMTKREPLWVQIVVQDFIVTINNLLDVDYRLYADNILEIKEGRDKYYFYLYDVVLIETQPANTDDEVEVEN